jgi:hypothetical protein
LGVSYGELAVPIGIHLAWNFFQGPVYGFAVSGTTSDQPCPLYAAGSQRTGRDH